MDQIDAALIKRFLEVFKADIQHSAPISEAELRSDPRFLEMISVNETGELVIEGIQFSVGTAVSTEEVPAKYDPPKR